LLPLPPSIQVRPLLIQALASFYLSKNKPPA
jgi:hypothetical protein